MSAPCPCCRHQASRVERAEHGRRRRKCERCGHRWTTVEMPLADVERLESAVKAARVVAEILEEGR
jgi:transcriptional regulator NrdR family protein